MLHRETQSILSEFPLQLSKMMHSSKNIMILAGIVLVLISNLSAIHMQSTPFLFREYIGAGGNDITFSDVPINPDVEFHFILSFAVDYTNSTLSIPTNGQFYANWDTEYLSPSAVLDIKAKHPNVKVAMSLGGDTIFDQTVNFTANTNDSWVNNATYSITNLVNMYHLDGIDIDYEHFNSDPNTFAECIGRLVTNLKENHTISFASIAPYADNSIQEHYTALWTKYGYLIDYVNFQFYAYENTTNVSQFVDYFDTQTSIYYGGKILASFGTDDSGGLSPNNGFFQACKILKDARKLQGIFIWSADDSKEANFIYEKSSQQFLLTGEAEGIGGPGGGKKASASSVITCHGMLMLAGFLIYALVGREEYLASYQ